MLIQAIHSCAVKFPEIVSNVVHLLMDFLGDTNGGSAVDVILFVRYLIVDDTLAYARLLLNNSFTIKLQNCLLLNNSISIPIHITFA
jgi:hypothetical protein